MLRHIRMYWDVYVEISAVILGWIAIEAALFGHWLIFIICWLILGITLVVILGVMSTL